MKIKLVQAQWFKPVMPPCPAGTKHLSKTKAVGNHLNIRVKALRFLCLAKQSTFRCN